MYPSLMLLKYLPFLLLLIVTPTVALPDSQANFDQIAKRADAAKAADHTQEAIQLYRQGLRLHPQWTEGWWSLATILYDQDRFAEAKTAFQRVAASTSKKGVAEAFLGLCEYETQDYGRALAHFRSWAREGWPGTPQSIDVAVFHFALLLTRDGEFVQALYLLGTEAAKTGENPALAEAMGLASLRMNNLPEDYPPEKREMVWLAGEAAVYAAQLGHEFERADEYSSRLAARYSQQPEVHYFRGTLYGFEGKRADAEREYREELRISSAHVPAMLGVVEVDLDRGELPEATSLSRRAVELDPKNPDAHHALGRVLLAKDQLDASAQELEIAKQLAPDSALVRSHLSMVYTRLGRMQQARAEADAFLRLKKQEGVLAPPEERLRSSGVEKTQ